MLHLLLSIRQNQENFDKMQGFINIEGGGDADGGGGGDGVDGDGGGGGGGVGGWMGSGDGGTQLYPVLFLMFLPGSEK